jgi:hypothetical protein
MNENERALEALGLQPGATPPAEGGLESGAGAGAPQGVPADFAPNFFGEEFTNWDSVKSEIPQRLARMTELQQELETYKNRPDYDFASPEIAEFNAFAKNTGVSDFGVFSQVKTITPENAPIDLMVLKQVMENPAYRGKEGDLKAKIMRDYQVDPDMYSATEIELNNIKLIEDAKKAGDWLSDLKGKMQVIAPDPEALKTKQLERAEAWKAKIQDLVTRIDKIPVPIPDGDKFKSLADYVLKEDVRNKYVEPLSRVASGLEVNDENLQRLERSYRNEVIVENLPYILDHALKLREAELNQEWEARTGGSLERYKIPGGGAGAGAEDIVDRLLRENKY